MKNINDIKDRHEAREFAEKGLKELENLFSDISNNVNGEWNEYISNIKNLGYKFAFSFEDYINQSIKLLGDYHQRKHDEQMKKSEEILRNSRRLNGYSNQANF